MKLVVVISIAAMLSACNETALQQRQAYANGEDNADKAPAEWMKTKQEVESSPKPRSREPSKANAGGYAIQLLAVKDKAKADSVARDFSSEGYETKVVSASGLFKVLVGGYQSDADARNALVSLKRRYQKNQYVGTGFVVASGNDSAKEKQECRFFHKKRGKFLTDPAEIKWAKENADDPLIECK